MGTQKKCFKIIFLTGERHQGIKATQKKIFKLVNAVWKNGHSRESANLSGDEYIHI